MGIPALNDLVTILVVSVGVVFLCSLVRIPALIGFLITGAVIGPYGAQWISAVHEVEILAEVGIVFLLFVIGVEFNIENFPQVRKAVLIGGTLQVGLTAVATFLIFLLLGSPVEQAIFWGFLLSLSSTAIVLKLLGEKAEMESPHGRTSLAVLIFQDLIIVPMMLVLPILGGESQAIAWTIGLMIIKAIFIISLIFMMGKYLVDPFMHQVMRSRNRELFFMTTIALCFFITWLTSVMGLSVGLGAFLAGLILSRSDYNHQILGGILPFRDVLISFFFISVGMLLDLEYTLQNWSFVLSAVPLAMILKTLICTIAILFLGLPLKTALIVGLSLSQIGEFSFVLSRAGMEYKLFNQENYQQFLSISIITMLLTPWIIQIAPRVANRAMQMPLPDSIKNGFFLKPPQAVKEAELALKDHLIIIGFGVMGSQLAHAARAVGIQYLVLELNPDTVKREKKKGEPIYYGDASFESVLEHSALNEARILVITIPDPAATRRIIELAKRLNPRIYIVARTRFVQEIKPLRKLGADEVIPEEYETSIEIFTRVLAKYLIPKHQIEAFIQEIRSREYEMLRSLEPPKASLGDLHRMVTDMEIRTLTVPVNTHIVNQTLKEVGLRKRYELTLLAVNRGEKIIANPSADFVFHQDDTLVVFGETHNIELFIESELLPLPQEE